MSDLSSEVCSSDLKKVSVSMDVDGDAIGSEQAENINVNIPSINEFKLVNVRVVQSPTQYVVLQFSDPLKENQNLAGLITIPDLPSLDFDIHDNEDRHSVL